MGMHKKLLRLLIVFFIGLPIAGNSWGANMQIGDYFSPEYVNLISAISNNDAVRAGNLVADGLSLNGHGEEGITPFFWLIVHKNQRAVAFALKLGADPNLKDSMGDSPVTFLAGGDDDQLLKLMLSHGGDPNAVDRNGQPALFGAIGQERWKNIELLLEYGVDPDITDKSNVTSTHYAAILNKYEIVHFLNGKGVDYRIRDTAGGDIAWTIHNRLEKGLLNPRFPAYGWALKVKEMLKDRGVEFPPPSPKTVRDRWARETE